MMEQTIPFLLFFVPNQISVCAVEMTVATIYTFPITNFCG